MSLNLIVHPEKWYFRQVECSLCFRPCWQFPFSTTGITMGSPKYLATKQDSVNKDLISKQKSFSIMQLTITASFGRNSSYFETAPKEGDQSMFSTCMWFRHKHLDGMHVLHYEGLCILAISTIARTTQPCSGNAAHNKVPTLLLWHKTIHANRAASTFLNCRAALARI